MKGNRVKRERTDDDTLDDAMIAVLRVKTERERLEMGFALWHFARDLMWKAVATEHGNWAKEQIQHEVAKRMSHGAV